MLIIDSKEVFTTVEELVNPKHTALLLIDIQNDFITPGGRCDKLGWDLSTVCQIVRPVKRVLQAARYCGILVVHVQMTLYPKFLADSPASLRVWALLTRYQSTSSVESLSLPCIDGTWGCQIVDGLTPLPNEVIVKKHRASAFMGTDLDMILRSNSIKSVAIAGVATNGCVLATANDTPFLDYYPVILRDCVASHSPELHDAALLIMSNAKDVVDSREVLKVWNRSVSQGGRQSV